MQKHKLRYLGVEFHKGLTKGEASDLLDEFKGTEKEAAWKKSKRRERLWWDEVEREIRDSDRFDDEIRVGVHWGYLDDDPSLKRMSHAKVRDVIKSLDVLHPGWEQSANKNALLQRQFRQMYPEHIKKSRSRSTSDLQPATMRDLWITLKGLFVGGCVFILFVALLIMIGFWGCKRILHSFVTAAEPVSSTLVAPGMPPGSMSGIPAIAHKEEAAPSVGSRPNETDPAPVVQLGPSLAELAEHPGRWPRDVALRQRLAVTGKYGSVELPRGLVLKLVGIETDSLVVVWNDITNRIPVEATDLSAQLTVKMRSGGQ
jgi:hypothetical protein